MRDSLTPEISAAMTRRQFFRRNAAGIALGIPALATLLTADGFGADTATDPKTGGLAGLPHFPPKARRVIFLHQSGAPSQMELFDYKPNLVKLQGMDLPDSVRMGQRITGMTSGQSSFPVAPSIFKFSQYGKSGAWISELLPYHTKIVDDITIIKSVYSEAINHDPAITFLQTGFQQPGRPSMGSWVSYGLGSENQNLPAFVVLISQANALNPDQPLFSRLWGSGFLPSRYQGVKFRASGDPVLYLSNPPGVPPTTRRRMLDGIAKLNRLLAEKYADPEIDTRVAQYEMAYRMQTSVPDLMDLSKDPESTPPIASSRGGWPSAECASFSSIIAAGISTTTCRETSPCNAKASISPPPLWCSISSSAACWTTLSSCGPANLAAPCIARASSPPRTMAATIIPAASPFGWP